MEIKAELQKPYTEEQRINFIIEYNRQYGYDIRETEEALQALGYTEEELAEQREANFKQEFFKVNNFGWYRKQPKGYTSALESLSLAYNMVTSGAVQELPAGTFIFYPTPDFTKPEECTEEWLVANHILSEAMTAQQFLPFYAQFAIAWNQQMHESEVNNESV